MKMLLYLQVCPSDIKNRNKSVTNKSFPSLAFVCRGISPALSWFILSEVQKNCHQHLPGSELAWPVIKRGSSQASSHCSKTFIAVASWLPNLREKVNIKLTVETVKDIRGDMLAMSSALGSGEKKSRTRLVLTFKLTFFYFFSAARRRPTGQDVGSNILCVSQTSTLTPFSWFSLWTYPISRDSVLITLFSWDQRKD